MSIYTDNEISYIIVPIGERLSHATEHNNNYYIIDSNGQFDVARKLKLILSTSIDTNIDGYDGFYDPDTKQLEILS